MDFMVWNILEIELMLKQLPADQHRRPSEPVRHAPRRSRIRGALASFLVRAGLRLDPAVAEGLRALKPSTVSVRHGQ